MGLTQVQGVEADAGVAAAAADLIINSCFASSGFPTIRLERSVVLVLVAAAVPIAPAPTQNPATARANSDSPWENVLVAVEPYEVSKGHR